MTLLHPQTNRRCKINPGNNFIVSCRNDDRTNVSSEVGFQGPRFIV